MRPRTAFLATTLAWFVLVGGTELGDLVTWVRAVNTTTAVVVIGCWLLELPYRADRTDRLVLAGLVAFLAACVASDHPRLSLDAATTALGFTATFSVVRWEAADPRAVRVLTAVLAWCAVVVILLFVSLWGSVWLAWMDATGSTPHLNAILPVGPYRGDHVVAMLVTLLLPWLVVAPRSGLMRPLAIATVVLGLGVVYASGSRTAWLALGLAGLAILARRVTSRRTIIAVALLAGVAVICTAVAGWLPAILDRLTTTSTLELRGVIWRDSLLAWLDQPLFGVGPGSFSLEFTFGEYLKTYERVGRHADNALVQLLMEAGIAGLLNWLLIGAGLVSGLRRAGPAMRGPAVACMVLYALMSLTDNPTDTANLTIIATCAAAIAMPNPRPAEALQPSWRTVAVGLSGAAILATTTSLLAASMSFDRSQQLLRVDPTTDGSAVGGASDQAPAALDLAISLDPGQAMYRRERALLRAASGTDATADLRAALELYPADTTAMRALALISAREGDRFTAIQWAQRAASLLPTRDANLTTLALVAAQTGEAGQAEDALVEAIRRTPWITASTDWRGAFPTGASLERLLQRAADAWEAAPDARSRFAMQQVWLAAATGRGPHPLLDGEWNVPHLAALDALLRCDLSAARVAVGSVQLGGVTASELGVMMMVAQANGDEEQVATYIHLAGLLGSTLGAPPRPESAYPTWDPGEDRRLYGRGPVVGIDLGFNVPTAAEGMYRWIQDPRAAAMAGTPGSRLALCSASAP